MCSCFLSGTLHEVSSPRFIGDTLSIQGESIMFSLIDAIQILKHSRECIIFCTCLLDGIMHQL